MSELLTIDAFVERHPRLFHVAEAGAWPSIRTEGLLSTTALLDLYGIEGARRAAIESEIRRETMTIKDLTTGSTARIRDNKPLRRQFLDPKLTDITVAEWCRLLNRKVFFWASEERLERLLSARAYRHRSHDVLTIETRKLVESVDAKISLAPINTGATLYPNATARGSDTFKPIEEYPIEDYTRWRGKKDAIVEVAVDYSVPVVEALALEVNRRKGCEVTKVLFTTL